MSAYDSLIDRLTDIGFTDQRDLFKLALPDIAAVIREFEGLLDEALCDSPDFRSTIATVLCAESRAPLDRITLVGSLVINTIKEAALERVKLDVAMERERREEALRLDREDLALEHGDFGENAEQALGMGREFR